MKHFNIKAGEKQYIVEADVIICGKDLNVCIGGGEVQHIGASALAIPRKSLANEEKNSASASVICVVGHKDGYFGVAEPPILRQDKSGKGNAFGLKPLEGT